MRSHYPNREMPSLAESVVEVLNKILDAAIIAIAAVAVVVTIEATRAFNETPGTTVCEVTTTATAITEPTATEPTLKPTQASTEATQPTTCVTDPPETTTETEPPVTLYDVPLATELQLHIIIEAEAHGIDPAIIFAMAYRESTYNAGCIGDSGASLGLLQVQPRWHGERMKRLGCTDLLDPFQNVTVGVDYLHELLGTYGSIEAALVAYNRGHFTGTVTEYARAVLAIAEELRGTTYESYWHQTGPQS